MIKSSASATGINQMVYAQALGEYDETDPTTWKYYLNICGEYYSSDELMYVTSLDTLETILFSKENLVYHRATARAYAFGTTYYKELVAKYPQQEQLIRGILYPADMQEAIKAEDGKILTYPPQFVESTEPSFIPRLQEWIDGFMARWHNVQYANFDNLYNAGVYGVMFAMMPGAIENIRQGLTRTYEAHSYHVREYLSSNSKIGQYYNYLTRRQAMYFYRNLKYIQTNAGCNDILDELIQRCMTERNLPIAHFTMLHSTEEMPGSLTPEAVFYKKPLNTVGNIDGRYYYSLKEVFDVTENMALGNSPYREGLELDAQKSTESTSNPVVPTKLLESAVIDYTDSERFRMVDLVLNHWLWLSTTDYYRAFVTFTIPATGLNVSLSAKDAFIFYAYALVKGYGYEMDELPRVVANRVCHLSRPTLEDIQAMVPKEMRSHPSLAEFISVIPAISPVISVEAFRETCVDLFKAANTQFAISALEETMNARGYLEGAYSRCWQDAVIDLAETPGQKYADWFAERNIVVHEYSQSQLAEIAKVILKEAVGENLASNITLKDIQNAMCSIILRLSSYSIQINKNINTGPVIDAGQIQIRADNLVAGSDSLIYHEVPTADPENVVVIGKHHLDVFVNPFIDSKITLSAQTFRVTHDLPKVVTTCNPNGVKSLYRMPIGVRTEVKIGEIPDNPRGLTIVSGMDKFLALPLETQIESYVDTWAK